MLGSAYDSSGGLVGTGGSLNSHGSILLGPAPGTKYSQVRHWASQIVTKLKYRGSYEEFPEWRRQVMSAAHGLSINMGLAVPTEEKLINIDPSKSKESPEFAKSFNALMDIFCQNSTNMYVLIHACVDFSGPMEAADAEWLDNVMHDFEKGWSWGHLLWDDIAKKASSRVDSAGEWNRILVTNADKWCDAEDNRALIISRISKKFVAWCHDPLTANYGVDMFLDPHLLGNFPSAPANTALPRIKLALVAMLRDSKAELASMLSSKQKGHWIREFLGQVDIWGKEFGMSEGSTGEGAGDSNMAMYGSKNPGAKENPVLLNARPIQNPPTIARNVILGCATGKVRWQEMAAKGAFAITRQYPFQQSAVSPTSTLSTSAASSSILSPVFCRMSKPSPWAKSMLRCVSTMRSLKS